MSIIENYPTSRVPANARLSFLSVTLVHAGMLTALDQFMLGAVLGHSMTLIDAFLAIFAGSLIFGVVTFAIGFAGMKEGLSSSRQLAGRGEPLLWVCRLINQKKRR